MYARTHTHTHTHTQEAVRIMAKDLVRTRNYIKKFYLMKANIQAISLKLQVHVHSGHL